MAIGFADVLADPPQHAGRVVQHEVADLPRPVFRRQRAHAIAFGEALRLDVPPPCIYVRDQQVHHALNRYGAVQLGTHRFYALRKGKPDLLTETSRFVDVWKLENGAWKLSRVVSYGHELDPAAQSAH